MTHLGKHITLSVVPLCLGNLSTFEKKGEGLMPLLKAVSVFKEVDSLERKRAEMLYVFAILSAKSGYCHIAKGAAEECILLLRKIGADTMEECATQTV